MRNKAKKPIALLMSFFILSGFNFKEPTCLSADELEKGLLHELKPLASTFAEIEQKQGINSVVYASLVALESGWGKSNLAQFKNNITSLKDGNTYKTFECKEDCLTETANHLAKEYLEESGKYYDGGTELEDIVSYYCVGKSKDSLNAEEQRLVDDYVGCVKNIAENILRRAGV